MSASPLAPSPRPAPAELDRGLAGTRFEGRVVLHELVDSTIDTCRGLADEGAPEGTVVLAEEQRRGRGSQGRGWHSPPGSSLHLSALLRPDLTPEQAPELVKLAGLAALRALREACGAELILKRPNDLLAPRPDGGLVKLGGLLVDTSVQGPRLRHAVWSLGLNVNQEAGDFPEALRPWAGSLLLVTGRRWAREDLAAAVLRGFEQAARALEDGRSPEWCTAWEREARELEDFRPPAWPMEETT